MLLSFVRQLRFILCQLQSLSLSPSLPPPLSLCLSDLTVRSIIKKIRSYQNITSKLQNLLNITRYRPFMARHQWLIQFHVAWYWTIHYLNWWWSSCLYPLYVTKSVRVWKVDFGCSYSVACCANPLQIKFMSLSWWLFYWCWKFITKTHLIPNYLSFVIYCYTVIQIARTALLTSKHPYCY